jgi:hypothetical protein
MSARPAVILPALFLKDRNRSGAAMPDNFGRDRCALHERLSDHQTGIPMHQTNLVQVDHATYVTGQALNLNRRASLNPILLSTCFNNCVHILFTPHWTESCTISLKRVSSVPHEFCFACVRFVTASTRESPLFWRARSGGDEKRMLPAYAVPGRSVRCHFPGVWRFFARERACLQPADL